MNLVAHGWGRNHLREGDEILLTEMEHHSNIVPWQMTAAATGATLRYIPLTDDGLLDLSQLGSLLTERTKIAERHRHVERARHDHAAATARRRGARRRRDRRASTRRSSRRTRRSTSSALDVDFLAFTGHKMLGPTASGGLYGEPRACSSRWSRCSAAAR